jgi:pyruvate, water dikinase
LRILSNECTGIALSPTREIGTCGEAPANYPEIARYLAELGIDSISVNPSSILRTM